jgi:hypothetical protein
VDKPEKIGISSLFLFIAATNHFTWIYTIFGVMFTVQNKKYGSP